MATFSAMILTITIGLLTTAFAAPADENRRRITYIMLEGNCPGSFLVDVPLKTLDECKQHCGMMAQCVGFSYSNERDICFLKQETCESPVIGQEFTFYQKFDPTLTDIPKILGEPKTDDPASRLTEATVAFKAPSQAPAKFVPRVEAIDHNEHYGQRRNSSLNKFRQVWPNSIGMVGGNSDPSSASAFNPPLSVRQALLPTIAVPQVECPLYAGSQSEFILMFMFNQPDQPQLFDLEIYVSSDPSPGNIPTEVQISMPRFPAYTGDRGTVAPGQTVLFKLPQSVRMTQTGVDSKAIRVSVKNPSAKINVYAVNKETYTSDGFLVFPTAVLGLEHYVLTWQPSTRGSEFGMAAPYDNTVVSIVLPAVPPAGSEPALIHLNGRSYSNGDTIQVTLQANDAFLAINENLNSDLTGTRIVTNKPVAVFSGDKRTAIKYISGDPPTRDHLVEQLPPVHTWGTEFVFCTSPNRTDGDFMKIVGSQDSIQILIYGGVSGAQQRTIPSAGTFVLLETAPQECLYISSTKPVMVGKFVVSQKPDQFVELTDPAAVVIPPTRAYHSAYSFMTPGYAGLTPGEQYTHFILIGVKKEYRDGFIVDGQPVPLQQIVPTYNDYICGYLLVPSGSHTVQHSNSKATYLAILYGAADRESYAFVLGESLVPVCSQSNPDCKPGTMLGTCPYCQQALLAQGCYGSILSLTCPTDRVVKVISAHYGWFPGVCGGSSCGPVQQNNCGMYNVYDNIARFCNGQGSCNFPVATNALFTNNQISNYFCPLCSTRVQVHYTCIMGTSLPCANLVGRTPLFVRYTASSFWRREPGRNDVTCPDDISMLTPIDAQSIPAYLPEFARYAAPHGLMWCPSECDTNSSFIQVDLGRVTRISGYAIQGRLGYEQWVSSVSIDYSTDGRTWLTLGSKPGTPPQQSLGMIGSGNAVWDGNTNAESVVVCDLTTFGIDARYVRAWVRSYQNYPCMRFDVFACSEAAQPNGTYNFTESQFPIFPPLTVILNAPTPVTNNPQPPVTNGTPQPPTNNPPSTGGAGVTTPGGVVTTSQPVPPDGTTPQGGDGGSTSGPVTSIGAPIPPGCPPLNIPNSDATGAPNLRGIIGQRTTVHCLGEWMLADFSIEFTVVCDSTGSWVGADTQCSEVRNCGPIPDVDHATYTTIGDPARVGGQVAYTCDPGYKNVGNPTLTCQPNTLWTAIPHCDPNNS